MASSLSRNAADEKTRVVGAARAILFLLGALVLWVCLGWLIDWYIAATAEERFKLALAQGDLAAACANAAIAADAYDIARDQRGAQKWRGVKAEVCRP